MPNIRQRITKPCHVCGKLFSMNLGDYKKRMSLNVGQRMYCSRRCYDDSRRVT